MEAKANYTLVGVMVLVLLTALIGGGLWLSTGFDDKKYNPYTVYIHESVAGLSSDSLVKYNGVKVGYIQSIELNPVDPQQVKLQLSIQDNTPITMSTQATLITQGITGNTYLGLSATSSDFTSLQKIPGEPYPVIPYHPSFFNQLEANINRLSRNLSNLLNKENTENLSKTLKDLPVAIKNLNIGIQKFSAMSESLSSAGNQVSKTMEAGKTSLDQLTQQTLPPAEQLLYKLNEIAANLEEVSVQIRQNPSVIVRGSTPPKPGPGE